MHIYTRCHQITVRITVYGDPKKIWKSKINTPRNANLYNMPSDNSENHSIWGSNDSSWLIYISILVIPSHIHVVFWIYQLIHVSQFLCFEDLVLKVCVEPICGSWIRAEHKKKHNTDTWWKLFVISSLAPNQR